jgi:membrane-bound lytic murein transglycosylase B
MRRNWVSGWWLAGLIMGQALISPAHAEERPDERPYQERAEVQAFVAQMVEQHGFSSDELLNLFANTEFQPSVIKAMQPPDNPVAVRSWERYRPRFVNSIRIARGTLFMTQYADALKRARETYGVPENIIAAIIGVETVYGQKAGNYRVMDVLTTLTFDYPRRADYFREELTQYLLMAREQKLDYFSVLGSYAGAIGLPQFMPTSVRQLAVDFDGDGKIDLRDNPVDAIGSVARYLQYHGWQTGAPIACAINFQDAVPSPWLENTAPAMTLADMQAVRFTTEHDVDQAQKFAVIPLVTPNKAPEYWLGYNNFYVITRYNRSTFYAMSVTQLAEALRGE